MEKGSAPGLNRRRLKGRRGPATGQLPSGTLEDVRRILGVGAKPVGEILPEAITEAAERRRPALTAALEPTVTETIQRVATRKPEFFGEILSPAIGVAVRKAIAAAIAALMQRFNAALERSLSVQSLRWRLEARRTGRPFSEVVLIHTLIYRVEQVFLIHGATGLVLQHVVAEGAPSADPDQVASMLSAIDSFSKEAFEPSIGGVYLHEFALGDLTVWIDRDPSIAVAVVVRGVAPRSLVDLVRETRERVYVAHRDDLATFVADVGPFERSRPILEACLREQHTEPRRRGPVILAALGLLAAAALTVFFITSRNRHIEEERQLAAYQAALAGQPGIVVTTVERTDGRYRVEGFRDPLAADPGRVIARYGYPRAELRFTPFYSLDPRVVEKRARHVVQPPPEVDLMIDGGTLRMSGEAPRTWIDRAVIVASAMPGIERVDVQDLRSAEALTAFRSAVRALEASEIHFDVGARHLSPSLGPAIEQAAALIRSSSSLSMELRFGTCITVIGDADETGSPSLNTTLAAERAAGVLETLRSRLHRAEHVMLRARSRNDSDAGPRARSVRFQVETRRGSPSAGCSEGGPG